MSSMARAASTTWRGAWPGSAPARSTTQPGWVAAVGTGAGNAGPQPGGGRAAGAGPGQVDMRPRMARDFVAGVDNGAHQFGMGTGAFTDHEERRRGVTAGEGLEHLRGEQRVGAVIEREGDLGAVGHRRPHDPRLV